MHFKTGLVSMPLKINEIKGFKPEQADPELVVKRYRKRGNEFKLEPADGSKIFKDVAEWCKS